MGSLRLALGSGFKHIARLTPNLDRFSKFYEAVFGAEVAFRIEARPEHPRMFVIDLGGGAALNVFETDADIGEIQELGDAWSLFFRDIDGMELEMCAPPG